MEAFAGAGIGIGIVLLCESGLPPSAALIVKVASRATTMVYSLPVVSA